MRRYFEQGGCSLRLLAKEQHSLHPAGTLEEDLVDHPRINYSLQGSDPGTPHDDPHHRQFREQYREETYCLVCARQRCTRRTEESLASPVVGENG